MRNEVMVGLYNHAKSMVGLYVEFPFYDEEGGLNRITIFNPRYGRTDIAKYYNDSRNEIVMEKIDELNNIKKEFENKQIKADKEAAKSYALSEFTIDQLLAEIRDRTY